MRLTPAQTQRRKTLTLVLCPVRLPSCAPSSAPRTRSDLNLLAIGFPCDFQWPCLDNEGPTDQHF